MLRFNKMMDTLKGRDYEFTGDPFFFNFDKKLNLQENGLAGIIEAMGGEFTQKVELSKQEKVKEIQRFVNFKEIILTNSMNMPGLTKR